MTFLANSEVLPVGSVAVALMTWPLANFVVKVRLNEVLPLALVVTLTAPRKVAPWPNPRESPVLLAKSSIRIVVFGVLGLVIVPDRIVLLAVCWGLFSTG